MFLHFNKDLVKESFVDLFSGNNSFLQVFDRAFDYVSYKFRPVVTFHSERHLWENLFSLQQTLLFSSKSSVLDQLVTYPIRFARTLTLAILFRNCVYMTTYNEDSGTTSVFAGNKDASTQCALSTLHEYDPMNFLDIDLSLLALCLEQKLDYTGTIEYTLFQFMYDISYRIYGVPIMPKYDDKYCYQGIASRLNLELELYLNQYDKSVINQKLEELEIDNDFAEVFYDTTVDNYYRYLLNDALGFLRSQLQNSYLIEFMDTCRLFELYENQTMRITTSAIKSIDIFSPSQKKAFITKVKNTHLLNYQLSQ
jgi:hypothetical protein